VARTGAPACGHAPISQIGAAAPISQSRSLKVQNNWAGPRIKSGHGADTSVRPGDRQFRRRIDWGAVDWRWHDVAVPRQIVQFCSCLRDRGRRACIAPFDLSTELGLSGPPLRVHKRTL